MNYFLKNNMQLLFNYHVIYSERCKAFKYSTRALWMLINILIKVTHNLTYNQYFSFFSDAEASEGRPCRIMLCRLSVRRA